MLLSNKSSLIFLLVFVLLIMATPVLAEEPAPGLGIQPISPDQFTQKVDKLIDEAYHSAAPLTDATAKITLAIAGVAALFVLFFGMKLFGRIIGAVLSVGFGLLLFYGAPYIVALMKGLTQ